jgi:hypothetical protein
MLGDQQETPPLSAPSAEPAAEQGALPTEIDYTDPEQYAKAGALQMDRERQMVQSQYDRDRELAADPANKPTRSEIRDWMRTNTDIQFGAGEYDYMGRQVIRDPQTGKLRWTALSPDDMDRIDARGKTTVGSIGALAYGSTRFGAATVSNAEAEIESRKGFQEWLLTGEGALPQAEQERIRQRLTDEYGADHRYAQNPGSAPPMVIKKILDENPANESALQAVAGQERSAERSEWFRRLGNRASALVPGMPLNVFGADETLGALTGRERYEGIQYEEGEAPAYPGASEDLQNWMSDAKRPVGLYESLVMPLVEGTTGKKPGAILTEGAENLRKKFYSAEQEEEREMPILNPNVEINKFSDLFNPELYNNPDTKIQNPESLFLMFMENAPELGFSFAITRGSGAWAARGAATRNAGQTLTRMNKAREAAAARAGMLTGGATEGLLVQGHVEAETRNILEQVPMET